MRQTDRQTGTVSERKTLNGEGRTDREIADNVHVGYMRGVRVPVHMTYPFNGPDLVVCHVM